jgi:hypothetical protein
LQIKRGEVLAFVGPNEARTSIPGRKLNWLTF